ncbi:MAG: phytase [Actinomycetia bacterium]|nr:phytase [Actinomycetes bacterium]
MRNRLVRPITALATIAAVLAAGIALVAPASAEAALVSELTFSPGAVTFDPYGTGTTIWGDVDATDAGVLDFRGRSVVETPDRPSLNPGTADFSFGARIALTRGVGAWNVMQKGNWGDRQWKLSVNPVGGAAQFSCRISGSAGILHVFTKGAVVAADGAWHQVACARIGNEVQVRFDGEIIATGTGLIGSVSSTKNYLVGSKGAGTLADPDQYLGLLDDAFVQVDLGTGVAEPPPPPIDVQTTALVETEPVLHTGDAADDPAIWPNPTDPSRSVVIGNDKGGALDVYDMQGQLLQRIGEGFFGNVDVHTRVNIGGQTRDIVAVYRAGLRLYTIDPDSRLLSNITDSGAGSISVPTGGEGLCLYRSAGTGSTYAFVISRAGTVAQYLLSDTDADGLVDASKVRQWAVGSEAEGCVADDELGRLYVSEEDVALWRYGAEPTDGTSSGDRIAVDRVVSAGGRLAPDIEGLTLVSNATGEGYVMASAQAGSDTSNYYAAYERSGSNAFVHTFSVADGTETDGCGRTDGIAAWAGDLGPSFPMGAFVCQDNANTAPGTSGNQNFKLVPLERVVPIGAAVNRPPAAVLDVKGCTALSCTFTAAMSWDPEGSPLTYTWDFGDGTQGEGPNPEHSYAEPGTYNVSVQALDPQGAVDSAAVTIQVTVAAVDRIAFRDASGVAVNATSASPRVPATIQPGDTLLLSVTANRSDISLTAPAGWQDLGRQVDESMQSRVFMRAALPGDAGALVRVGASGGTKMVAQILAYSGTNAATPIGSVASAAELSKAAGHRTPSTISTAGSWAVSLWSNKSSSTTGWTAPAGVNVRQYQGTASTGRTTALAADSGGPVGTAAYGGLTAVASQVGTMATMWTIVLNPR